MKVRINIESLVLNGFSRQDTAGFARGLEQELSRLVRENGVNSISNADALDAGNMCFSRGTKPDLAGAHTARSIYRSLRR
jgi:hypothetical protein